MNPKLYIIAGPNGAGKTTFAHKFLLPSGQGGQFVNADDIAKQLNPEDSETAAFRAGRQMLEELRRLSNGKSTFTIETTLAGKAYLSWLREIKMSGYKVHLFFLCLPDVQMSLDRVAYRVRKGGHNIPEPVIRRRLALGIKNLFAVYRPVVDSWTLFDNSSPELYMIAREVDGILTVLDEARLAQFMKIPRESDNQKLQDTAEVPEWMKAVSALREAIAGVIEDHLKTGDPLVVWRDGKVYRQPPEEAKREFENSLKKNSWPAAAASAQI